MKRPVCGGGVHRPGRTCTGQGAGMAWFGEGRRSPSMTQDPSLALFSVGWVTVASPSLQNESDAPVTPQIA